MVGRILIAASVAALLALAVSRPSLPLAAPTGGPDEIYVDDYVALGQSDNTAAQNAITAAKNTTRCPRGCVVVFGSRSYSLSSTLDLRMGTNNSDYGVSLRGTGSRGSTVLNFSELGSGAYAVDLDGSWLRDLSVVGPQSSSLRGSSPASMDGVWLGTKPLVEDVSVKGFRRGLVFNGDHQRVHDSLSTENFDNAYFLTGDGNQVIDSVDLTGPKNASLRIGGDAVISGGVLTDVHLGFGPFCLEADAKNTNEGAITGSAFTALSFEACGYNAIFDAGYGGTNHRNFAHILWQETMSNAQDTGYQYETGTPPSGAGTYFVQVGLASHWTIQGGPGDSSQSFPWHPGSTGIARFETLTRSDLGDVEEAIDAESSSGKRWMTIANWANGTTFHFGSAEGLMADSGSGAAVHTLVLDGGIPLGVADVAISSGWGPVWNRGRFGVKAAASVTSGNHVVLSGTGIKPAAAVGDKEVGYAHQTGATNAIIDTELRLQGTTTE